VNQYMNHMDSCAIAIGIGEPRAGMTAARFPGVRLMLPAA
jgi:hypothetical protein